MARQGSLGFEEGSSPLSGPLTRPLSEAWQDLPPAWAALCTGLEAQAAAVASRVDADAQSAAVGPARPFRAFELVRPEDVRLLIVGQDPYPTPGDATGLAFSTLRGVPRSMLNVYKAFEAHVPGFSRPGVANLEHWAQQGVLLLNTALTVRLGQIGSHLGVGWQEWTQGVVRALYGRRLEAGQPVPAERVLRARHPSNDFKKEFVAQAAEHLARLQELLQPPIRW
jgi:uracil-DNA glycosylase